MKTNSCKSILAIVLVLFLAALACQVQLQPVSAQESIPSADPEYTLSVSRTFGYSAGGQIRGSFRLSVVGDQENIRQVVFLLDGQPIGTVIEPPFQMDIHTQDYPEGTHTLSAEITTIDGSMQAAQGGTFNFVSASEQWSGIIKIIVAIGLILAAIVGVGFLFTYLTTGKTVKDLPFGAERHYGLQGGGICSRCGRPFAFHWWGLNQLGSKYDRCDYCGKWGSFKRLPEEELREAEGAEMQSGLPGTTREQPNQEEALRKMLDDSKFDPD